MKNISISDENETIYLYSGMQLTESEIDPLERIFGGLLDKIRKLERNAPTPEGTRLNILEYSHDTLWKAHVETKKILEEMRPKVSDLSGGQILNRIAHARIYKETDKNHNLIDHLAGILARDSQAARKRDKRISDIEEFLGDL